MLGLYTTPLPKSPTKIPNLPPIQSSASNNSLLPLRNLTFPFVPLKSPPPPPPPPPRSSAVVVRAGGPTITPEKKEEEERGKGNGRPRLNLRRWIDLVLDPAPDNLVAVGLTGLLTWASLQVLWQLFFISLAILVAALKYSFIAAILLFILITLL